MDKCMASPPASGGQERAVAIIPARYAATRLPGKPIMRDPRGKYVIEYVCQAASKAKLIDRVIVATDDKRIFDVVTSLGFAAAMTSDKHPSGSDRIAEVARGIAADVVVNIQGDEPQIRPEQIDQVVSLLREAKDCVVSTLASRIELPEELADPNVVKVVVDNEWRALYFSRLPIPCVRGAKDQLRESPAPHLRHIGIYGYRREFLLQYVRLPRPAIEDAEKLEQLRVLASGYKIKVGLTPYRLIGIDTPADFEAFCRQISSAAT